MPTLSKIRKKQNNYSPNTQAKTNIQAKNIIDQLSSFPEKTPKYAKLIEAIKLSLKFWNLRNQDRASTEIVNHYISKAKLEVDKRKDE